MGSLPREIWIDIFEIFQLHGSLTDDDGKRLERFRLNTLLNISLTCKGFHWLVRPILYRTLDFEIHNASVGLPLLIKLLVDDMDIWRYVRQVRLPMTDSDTGEFNLWLSTWMAGKEAFDLLAQLDMSDVSSRIANNVLEEGLEHEKAPDYMAAILLCLCRQVRRLDWRRSRDNSKILPVLAQVLAESRRVPNSALCQALPKLSLEKRPCAEIRVMHIDTNEPLDMGDFKQILKLPSLRSLDIAGLFLNLDPVTRYSHPRSHPTWHLQELRLHRCYINAYLVADLVRGCQFLKSLDLDVYNDVYGPFNYAHLGENLIRYNQNLEVLIFSNITSHAQVPLLEKDGSSLNHLNSLRKLALPLQILWDLPTTDVPSFTDILPTSLEQLHIFSSDLRSPGEASYDGTFSELIRSRQYPELKSIRVGTTEIRRRDLTKDLGEKANGWKGGRDMEGREHIYTRNTKKDG